MTTAPTVLLIEDNDQNAYLARYLLERSGMRVVATRTGADGLRLAASERPDVVLLDIQLPDANGYRIAERLHGDAATRDIPIVAVTSFAMPAEREKAMAVGCAGYIEKPIAPLRFADQVRSFVRQP